LGGRWARRWISSPGSSAPPYRSKTRVNALMALRSIRDASKCKGQPGQVYRRGTPGACRGQLRTDTLTQHSAEIPVIGGVCLNSANE